MNVVILAMLVLSTLCQTAAALLTLRLIRVTGNRKSWIIIAAAFALMAARRAEVLGEWLLSSSRLDLFSEATGLATSLLLLLGLASIATLFASIERSRKELIAREERFKALVENAADAFFVHDAAGKFIDVNINACVSLGYSREELLALSVPDIDVTLDREELASLCSGIRPGSSVALEGMHRRKDGSLFPVEIHLGSLETEGGAIYLALVRDSSERKKAERELRTVNRALTTLIACSQALVRISEEPRLLAEICRIIVEVGGYRMAWVGFPEFGGDKAISPAARAGHDAGYLDGQDFTWDDSDLGRAPAGSAVRTGLPCISNRIGEDPALLLWRDEAQARGYNSCIAIPLQSEGTVFGVITIYSEVFDAFDDEEVKLLLELGEDLSYGITALRTQSERLRAETALVKSEARYKRLVGAVTDYMYTVEVREGHPVRTTHSPSCVAVTGYMPEEYAADPHLWYRMIVEEDRPAVLEQAAEVLIGTATPLEHRIIHKNGQVRWVKNTPVPRYDERGALIAYDALVSDITERKLAEDELRLKSAALESADNAVMITDRNGAIIWVNPAFTRLTGYSFAEVADGNPRALRGDIHDEQFYRDLWETILSGKVWRGEMVNRRKDGVLYHEEQTITPVTDSRGRIGYFIAIKQDITERKHAEQAVLENTRILRDMEIAQQIQLSLLPSAPPEMPGIEVASRCIPATHVGGDYYDYFVRDNGVLDVVIADVSGHSVGAALMMAETRSVLHAKIHSVNSASGVLSTLNDLLYDDLDRAELFITMFFVKYDAANRLLTYANAGHNRPLLFRHGACGYMEIDADGLVMGVKRDVEFEERTLTMQSGDILILYTDGIIEAQDLRGDFFGTERVCAMVVEQAERPAEEILDAILHELHRFIEGTSLNDDTSLVVLKFA